MLDPRDDLYWDGPINGSSTPDWRHARVLRDTRSPNKWKRLTSMELEMAGRTPEELERDAQEAP